MKVDPNNFAQRKIVNEIIGGLINPLIPDVVERITVGNQATTDILTALSGSVDDRRRETIARIVDPYAWQERDRFLRIINGEGRPAENEEQQRMMLSSATRRVDAVVEASLMKADLILSPALGV